MEAEDGAAEVDGGAGDRLGTAYSLDRGSVSDSRFSRS
jgi:hypothetical protein